MENPARVSPLTCNEYDTERPTKPALRLCREITANRVANRTIQLPTHSSRTASHLHETHGREVDRCAHTLSQLFRDLVSSSGGWGWGGGAGLTEIIPESSERGLLCPAPRTQKEGRPKGHGFRNSSLIRQPQDQRQFSGSNHPRKLDTHFS